MGVPDNPFVGEMKPGDLEPLKTWTLRQLDKYISENAEEYKAWRTFFPKKASKSFDEFIVSIDAQQFEQIEKEMNFHNSVLDLLKAMRNESEVCMLVYQMNIQTPTMFRMDVPDFIYLLNKLITFAPLHMTDDLSELELFSQ